MLACLQFCPYRSSLELSVVCSPTGLKDEAFDLGMSVSPNPTTGEILININLLNPENFTISVLNALGQTIKEIK